MVELNQEHHLGPKAFFLFLLWRTGVVVIILIIAGLSIVFHDELLRSSLQTVNTIGFTDTLPTAMITSFVASLSTGLFVLSGILFVTGFIVSWIKYRYYTFTFEEFDMKLKRGFLFREEVAISYRQMQNVNIERTIFYQILGVSKVVINSGANEEMDERNETDIVLEPIDEVEAHEIRDMLQRKIGVQKVERVK